MTRPCRKRTSDDAHMLGRRDASPLRGGRPRNAPSSWRCTIWMAAGRRARERPREETRPFHGGNGTLSCGSGSVVCGSRRGWLCGEGNRQRKHTVRLRAESETHVSRSGKPFGRPVVHCGCCAYIYTRLARCKAAPRYCRWFVIVVDSYSRISQRCRRLRPAPRPLAVSSGL